MFAATKAGSPDLPIEGLQAYFPLTDDTSAKKPLLYPYATSSGSAGTFGTASGFGISPPPTGTGKCMREPSSGNLYLGATHPTDTSFFRDGPYYTIEWFHYLTVNTGEKASAQVAAGDSLGANNYQITFPYTPNSQWGYSWWFGGYGYDGNLALNAGTWYHLCVMMRSNSTVAWYVNGVLKRSQAISSWNKKSGWLNLFFSNGWTSYTTEVRVWNIQAYDQSNTGSFTVNTSPLF